MTQKNLFWAKYEYFLTHIVSPKVCMQYSLYIIVYNTLIPFKYKVVFE